MVIKYEILSTHYPSTTTESQTHEMRFRGLIGPNTFLEKAILSDCLTQNFYIRYGSYNLQCSQGKAFPVFMPVGYNSSNNDACDDE